MTDAHPTLQPALHALQSGDRETARRLLAAALRANSQDVQAWLRMSEVVDTAEQKRECLLRVLSIEPDNAAAQADLARLEGQALRDGSDWPEAASMLTERDLGRPLVGIAATAVKAGGPEHRRMVERYLWLAGGLLLTLLVGLAILGFALLHIVPQARDGSASSFQDVLHTATLWCPSCAREGQPVVLSTRIGARFYQGARASGLAHGTRVAVLRYQWSTLEGRYYALIAGEGKQGWVPEEQIRK